MPQPLEEVSTQPRQVQLGEGLNWYACGWRLFRRHPVNWVLVFVLMAFFSILLMVIPVVGQLALVLTAPVFLGGLYRAAKAVDDHGHFEIKTLFEGFTDSSKTSSLLLLGAMMLAATIVITLIAASLLGGSLMTGYGTGINIAEKISAGVGTILGMLLLLLLQGLVMMVIVYAVPLVMLDGLAPAAAVKSGFSACLTNLAPLLIFGVVYLLLVYLAAIPFYLGYVILVPVTLCAAYCSYKSVFHP